MLDRICAKDWKMEKILKHDNSGINVVCDLFWVVIICQNKTVIYKILLLYLYGSESLVGEKKLNVEYKCNKYVKNLKDSNE